MSDSHLLFLIYNFSDSINRKIVFFSKKFDRKPISHKVHNLTKSGSPFHKRKLPQDTAMIPFLKKKHHEGINLIQKPHPQRAAGGHPSTPSNPPQ